MTYDTINDAATMRGDDASALGSIDKYELVRELGEGGFGTVYLAHDTVAGVDVAVKGLPPEVKHNESELESIRGNFALVKRLRHPNIVAVTDLHQALSVSYSSKDVESKLRVFERDTMVVMDYAPGVTLAKWRRQFPGGKVPLDKAIAVVRQVASALDYAHGQKVLHRDVKPANVMVESADGGKLVARVLDFGLAAEIRSSMGRLSREIRDTSGTRPYMAPEQWLGKKQGPATDQYALAVMFYELVVGDVPFASVFDCGDLAVMRLAVTTDAPAIPADLPKCVRRALAVALAKKPEDRFASCGEFAAALEGKKVPRSGAEAQRKGGAGRAIAALALLAALAGGVWWMKEGAKGTDRTDGTDSPPVASVPPVVSVPPVASDPSPKPDEAEDWAKAEAVKIRIEAKVEQDRVTRISDADGFDSRKNTLADVFARAEALFDEKVKRWGEAAQGFSNYVAQCVALRRLDVERLSAVSVRDRATEAKRKAESVDAKEYAETRWREANDLMEKGVDEFGQMHFVESVTAFASAAGQFGKCESEAKDERARRDDEARKERERQDRELQAKIRTALESAREYASGGKWQQCVGECDTVLGWDNANVEAKRLKAEAESNLVPTAKVVVKVNGTELKDGETVRIGPTEWKTPIVWGSKSITEGKTYGGEVVYEKEDKKYVGRLENFKVDWHGNQNFEVALKRAASLNGDKKSNEESLHEGVQLWEGGPYWADRNIGAENPWDYGYYFWWGGTVGYKRVGKAWVASDGSSSGFSFRGPSIFSKLFGRKANIPTSGKNLADLRNEGWITQPGALAPEHDAAHVHWGGNWRMPSEQELSDLNNNCDWIWTQKNGVNGYEVRGKGAYASKSIYLPCAGYVYGTSLRDAGSDGDYWSSVPGSDSYRAWHLYFGSSSHDTYSDYRDYGQSVRPVRGFAE